MTTSLKYIVVLQAALGGLAAHADAASDVAARVRALTGAPTRLAWCQYAEGHGDDRFANGTTTRLCGFDTEGGAGERIILGKLSSYAKPIFVPGGDRVVYSDRQDGMVYVVNWNGSGLRELCRGFASDAWRDAKTSLVWIYVRGNDGLPGDPIVRHRLDKPSVSEVVWDRTRVGHDLVPWFRLSADGSRAGGAFPWQSCGVADLAAQTWTEYGRGCWTSICPDDSYRFFIFDSGHRTITMFDAGGANRRTIAINGGEHIGDSDVYAPRWSNDPRFLTMTGPGGHLAGARGELHLAKFNADFTAVAGHVRVTYNKLGDLYGDAWIAPGDRPAKASSPQVVAAASPRSPIKLGARWPESTEGLVYLWESSAKVNEIRDSAGRTRRQCLGDMRGRGHFGRHYEMRLAGGAFVARDVNEILLAACRRSNQLTVEAVIQPDDLVQDGPARIISFSTDTGSRNFTLGQAREKLVFRLRTPRTGPNGSRPQHTLCRVAAGRPQHVVVTCRPGRLVAYLDGKEVYASIENWGDFSNWDAHHLLFGDEFSGGRDWSGRLEGVAVYSRFMEAEEVARRFGLAEARLTGREPAPRRDVVAKLLAATPTPDPKKLAPYRRCLAEHLYEIVKDGRGDAAGERIVVAHWVVLGGEIVAADRQVGQRYRLELEPMDSHPQLEGERIVSELDAFDLPVFYGVGL